MAHEFLANAFGDVMKISDGDARKLAVAWCNWRQYYTPFADSKSIALGALIVCAWSVEMPRVTVLLMQRRTAAQQKAAAAKAAQAAGGGRIMPFDGLKGV